MDIKEQFKAVGSSLILRDKSFRSECFKDFLLCPQEGEFYKLLNLRFDRCKVSPGSCMISGGVTLCDVSFSDFECGDAMQVDSAVSCERVSIEGSRFPKMLWIRPGIDGSSPASRSSRQEFSLDISGFKGEVSITGVPVNHVVVDPPSQVKIRLPVLERADWKGLGIGGLSFWRMMARKIKADGAEEGIFSLPPRKNRSYGRSIEELRILRKEGILE